MGDVSVCHTGHKTVGYGMYIILPYYEGFHLRIVIIILTNLSLFIQYVHYRRDIFYVWDQYQCRPTIIQVVNNNKIEFVWGAFYNINYIR